MLSEKDDKVEKTSVAGLCVGLRSGDRKIRKLSLVSLENFLKTNILNEDDLRNVFVESQMYTLNALRDQAEVVREQAIKFWKFFLIDCLPHNDFYLTYVFPILVERIGNVELIEESEEVRLEMLNFLHEIILKYSQKEQLKPFLGDIVIILKETVKDKFPTIKELSCRVIIDAANALPQDFHMQGGNLINPVLTCLSHQRYKVRLEAIRAIGEIIMHTYEGIKDVVNPLAERLFDQIPIIRRTVAQVAARWLLEYRDRYSYFQHILPLILTGLNDEVEETRVEASALWEKVGLQYEKENEKDLKDELDYLQVLPKYYPENLKRPNLGCRVLVQRNVSKIVPALSAELTNWQPDIRVRCSQLLCVVAWHAEQHLTQNLQGILPAMYSAARDDDPRVIVNIEEAAKIIGLFVPPKTWLKLVLPIIEDGVHWGHFSVLANLIKGTPQEYIAKDLLQITEILANEDVCFTRKRDHQRKLLECCKALMEKYNEESGDKVGYHLFKLIVVLHSLKDEENTEIIPLNVLLEDLGKTLKRDNLWICYLGELLAEIDFDPFSWTIVSSRRCIFETVLLESGEAFGQNLEKILKILVETLNPDADGESRLKTFWALSEAFEQKEIIFRKASKLEEFVVQLINNIFIPNLVWHAGRTAEAMRTMSAACLKSALEPSQVDLFKTGESLKEILDKLLPLLLSLMEDASSKSRKLAIEIVALVKINAEKKGIWDEDLLVKVYPEILKRLDDPTEYVRLCAFESLPTIFTNCPKEFKEVHYKSHHKFIIDTLLTHFDDKEVEELVFDALKVFASIEKETLLAEVKGNIRKFRNQEGCSRLINYLETPF